MLHLIGLGLDWGDLSLTALEVINQADEVYLEAYTSVSNWSVDRLKRLIGKKITVLDRKDVEEGQAEPSSAGPRRTSSAREKPFFREAHLKNIALLFHGDPLTATTHIEILLEAKKRKIKTKIIHSNSILTAVAETGLSLYKFGKVASIPLPEKGFAPGSFYDILKDNQSIYAHTLFLLDLKPKKRIFLTIPKAIKILLDLTKRRKEKAFTEKTFCIGCARLGTETQKIKAGTAKQLVRENWGNPPYCLIVPAKLHFKEEEFLKTLQ